MAAAHGDDDHPETIAGAATNGPGCVSEPVSDGGVHALDERIQGLLGRQLSAYYGELVNEPVPERFLELLSRLDQKERGT